MSRPQHHKAVRLRLVPAALGLGAVIALAGCSAGQTAQTQSEVAAVNGGSATVRQISVQDATFTFPPNASDYPAGSTMPLQADLINGGSQADRLLRVSSPYAASVQISGDTNLPGGVTVRAVGMPVAPSTPTSSTSSSAAPNSAPMPSGPAGPSSSAAPTMSAPSSLPSEAPLGPQEVRIVLVDVRQTVTPGVTVPVTFYFANAGPVTVQVPLATDNRPRPEHNSPGPY